MNISRLKIFFVIVISTILLAPSFSLAFGSWSQETTARELCFLYTLSKDWQQTLEIANNPSEHSETNPILSSHPDTEKFIHILRHVSCSVYITTEAI